MCLMDQNFENQSKLSLRSRAAWAAAKSPAACPLHSKGGTIYFSLIDLHIYYDNFWQMVINCLENGVIYFNGPIGDIQVG